MSTTEGAFYYPPLENLPIFDVLVFRNAQDVTDFAINSENSLITNTTSGTPYYPTFVDSSSGYERIRTNDPSYTYNANTNTISANTSGTAAVATQVAITNTSFPAIFYPTFVRTPIGNQSMNVCSPTFAYNLLINELTVNISGTAVNASNITIADNDTSGTFYLTFASAGVGNKALLYDSITTPLSYIPSISELSLGSFDTTNNSNVNSLFLGSKNSATIFMTYGPGLPALTTGDFNVIMGGNIGTNLAGGSNNFALGYNAFNNNINGCNNCIMGHRAALGLGASGNFFTWYNVVVGDTALTNADDVAESTCIGSNTGLSMLNGNLKCTCIGAGADCADGLSYSTSIGAGVLCSTSNTVQIGRSADTIIFDGTVTNTIAQPASNDSSTKMPTTAWVQTAITAGSVTNATNVALTSDNTSGTYYIPFSKTTSPTSNALYIDDATTPLVYNPSNNEISTSKYSLGGLAPVSGANAGFFAQNLGSSASVIQNQATSGFVFLNTRTALNALTVSLSVSSTAASFNAANVTLSGTSINVGQGAGGTSNLIVGNTNAKSVVFTTGRNTLIGTSAGQNMTAASDSNTLIGNNAGLGITSSTQNTFVGYGAGNQASGTGAGNNVAVGFSAGAAMITTATQNTLVGVIAASSLNTGTGNCIYGFGAASGLTTGVSNTVIGLQAGDLMTGSFNTVIGSGADVPTAAGSNQIAIGTITETMFLQGQLNYRIGTAIAAAVTLPTAGTTLAQFYSFSAGTAYTITLPVPTLAAYRGATVTFKRKTNNTNIITFAAGAGTPFVPIAATAAAATIALATGVYQVTFICDGVNWCSVNQA